MYTRFSKHSYSHISIPMSDAHIFESHFPEWIGLVCVLLSYPSGFQCQCCWGEVLCGRSSVPRWICTELQMMTRQVELQRICPVGLWSSSRTFFPLHFTFLSSSLSTLLNLLTNVVSIIKIHSRRRAFFSVSFQIV